LRRRPALWGDGKFKVAKIEIPYGARASVRGLRIARRHAIDATES